MWKPDVTVAAICERQGQFLMVEERSKSSGQIVLNQPAGHIEDGETIIQAVNREMLEETCRHFSAEAMIGLYRLRTQEHKTYIRYTFCGKASDRDPAHTLDTDIIATHWMSLADLETCENLRSDLILKSVNDYIEGTRYPLEILREL